MKEPLDDFLKEVRDFAEEKEDQLKLKTSLVGSTASARLLSGLLILNVSLVLLTLLSFTAVLFVGDLIGSYAWGALIVSCIVLVVLVLLVAFRKKLFVNGFVRMFMEVFYGSEK